MRAQPGVIALELAVEPEQQPDERRDAEAQQHLGVDRFPPERVVELHQARFRSAVFLAGAFLAGDFFAGAFFVSLAAVFFLPSTEAFKAADRKSTRLNSSH